VAVDEEDPAAFVERRHRDRQGVDQGAQAPFRLACDARGPIRSSAGGSGLADRAHHEPHEQHGAQAREPEAHEEVATERGGEPTRSGGGRKEPVVGPGDQLGERAADLVELLANGRIGCLVARLELRQGGFEFEKPPLHLVGETG